MATIRDRLRAFISPPKSEMIGEVALADPNNLFPSGSFLPSFNPSILVRRKGLKVFDRMLRDDQVKGALDVRHLTAVDPEWDIIEGSSKDAAEFVHWNLESYLDRSLEEILRAVLLSEAYGYSIGEMVFEFVPDGPWAGMIGLHDVKSRKPHSFQFKVDRFGNLEGLRQDPFITKDLLPPRKFVILVNRMIWGNWYGTSELEAAYPPWFGKHSLFRWMLLGLERFGDPPIFGGYNPQGMPVKVQQDIKKILSNIMSGTSGIIPRKKPDDFELITPNLGDKIAPTFIPALRMLDEWIAKALLVPSLIGFTGDASGGSLARSQTHFSSFMLVIESIQKILARNVMDRQIIPSLVIPNFGPQEVLPQFRWQAMTEEQRAEAFKRWGELLAKGAVRRGEDDEDHIRSGHGMPAFKKPEDADPEPVGFGGNGSSHEDEEEEDK